MLGLATTSCASIDKTAEQYIADLGSPRENVVENALDEIEKHYPTSLAAQAKIKTLLMDERIHVKRKAARTLGNAHAEVNETDIKNIATLLDAKDAATIIDGLKSLRNLKAQSTVPKIIPLLQNLNHSVIRDSIRTLAALGDEKLIPILQPFLTFPDENVQKDAAYAIELLKTKP